MIFVKTVKEVRNQVKQWKQEGYSIGFVPTMGFLHEGHQSLIEKARKENDIVVVSIFVNPTQFGPNEDFECYPRDIEKDKQLCVSSGADLIFNPDVDEMYEKNASITINVEGLSKELCGKSRPTHFNGVCLVVGKLFNIVSPDRAYFGEKDAQQLAIIKKMVKDLNFDIEIVGCPIVREADGLAKSSRNTYLSDTERKAATILHQALSKGKLAILDGERNATYVKNIIRDIIEKQPLARIDYVDVVRFDDISPVEILSGNILVAIAVYIGKTRLIDNFIIQV